MPRPRPPEVPEDEPIVTISVRFPQSVLTLLRNQAQLEERALNTVIVRAARSYLGIETPKPFARGLNVAHVVAADKLGKKR